MSAPRIAIGASRGRLEGLDAALSAAGAVAVRAPLVATRALPAGRVRDAARALLELPWILVASRAAVEAWAALGIGWDGPRWGAVGPATAAALQSAGARVHARGEPADADGLADAFLARADARGPVGLPRGDRSREALPERLAAAGFETRPLVLYRTVPAPWPAGLEPSSLDALVVASPSGVEALPAGPARLIAIGPTTAAALRAAGRSCHEAPTPDPAGILAALRAAGALPPIPSAPHPREESA